MSLPKRFIISVFGALILEALMTGAFIYAVYSAEQMSPIAYPFFFSHDPASWLFGALGLDGTPQFCAGVGLMALVWSCLLFSIVSRKGRPNAT